MTKMPPTKAADSLSHHAGSGKRMHESAPVRTNLAVHALPRFRRLRWLAAAAPSRRLARDDDFGHPLNDAFATCDKNQC
jgi:hypothetical protein